MIETQGDIWDHWQQGKVICITTNGTLRQDGKAVMGAGVAKQAKELIPELPGKLGEAIKSSGNAVHYFPEHKIITFPVKHRWWDNADIDLIKRSCSQLMLLMDYENIESVVLPRPGCGNGGLNWKFVKKEIEPMLDDSVVIIDR